MKIRKIDDVTKFFDAIDRMEGEAWLVNKEGRINMKSKLSQFIIIAKCMNNDLSDVEIEFSEDEDRAILEEFLDE